MKITKKALDTDLILSSIIRHVEFLDQRNTLLVSRLWYSITLPIHWSDQRSVTDVVNLMFDGLEESAVRLPDETS